MSANAPSMKQLFSNRFVQVILLAGLFIQIGIWVRNFSILLYVVDQTGNDPYAVSLISVAEFLPIFLFSFIGGTFADRWRPKRTMIWCDFLSAVSIFAVLLAILFGTWKAVFFATLVSSILSQFSQPAGMKLFKLHVPEELMQMGMSMYQTLFAIFMILGPIIGGFVYQYYGINVAIAVTGAAFLFSALVLLKLPSDKKQEQKAETSFKTEIKEGFRYVKSRKVLTTLGGCFLTAGLALGIVQPLGVFLVTEQLGLEKEQLQWFMTVSGAAMLIGGGFVMSISKKVSPQILLTIGMVASAVTLFVSGISTSVALTLTMQFLSGLVMPGIHIGINTLILKNTDESFVGRVNGILNPLFMGGMVIMMMAAGLIKETTSLTIAYSMSAALFVIGVLVMVPILRLPASPEASPQAVEQQTT